MRQDICRTTTSHAVSTTHPTPPCTPAHRTTYVPRDLQEAKEVFIRRDHTKPPLQRPYEGPFPVVARNDKMITVERKGHDYTTSLDRVKAVHIPPAQPDLQQTKLPIPTQHIPLFHPSEFLPSPHHQSPPRSALNPLQLQNLTNPYHHPHQYPTLILLSLNTFHSPKPTTPTTTRQISTPAPNPLPYPPNPPQPPLTPIHPPTQANHALSDFNPEGTILHTGR
ncbi:hypothetical protein Pcinc_001464 [Petrolisthes cinctipes]|uniref:Uncharacterized protein n=1 Tax=Petrolisthes cinctipes TaxID=88211 RepID=A0AAE1GMQ4_PETCI|nr:hypothetical protein Pcinc_001464 [Petrolisthes cinctipes]